MSPTTWVDDSLYLLFKQPSPGNYTICGMRSFLHPNCSTIHEVSGTAGGSTLISHCYDPDDKQAYALSVPESPISMSHDWVNIAVGWGMSLALNDGVFNGNASNARLLAQLIPTTPVLPPLKPSLAEALAVLVGSTLLMSTKSAAFTHYWEFPSASLNPGNYMEFNASLSTQQYTSTYTQTWQALFYPVLIVVAIINVWCLIYYFRRSGLVTDYTEPQNLFALAINSPASKSMAGSCGAGPEDSQFEIDWCVKIEQDTAHYYIQEGESWKGRVRKRKRKTGRGYEMTPQGASPNQSVNGRVSTYSKLSSSRNLL